MEKKFYMEPSTRVIVAQTAQFLTSSGGGKVHSDDSDYSWGIGYGGSASGDEDMD